MNEGKHQCHITAFGSKLHISIDITINLLAAIQKLKKPLMSQQFSRIKHITDSHRMTNSQISHI